MQICRFLFIRLRSSTAGNWIQENLGSTSAPMPPDSSLSGHGAAETTLHVAFSARFSLVISLRAGTRDFFWALTRRREPEKITLDSMVSKIEIGGRSSIIISCCG